VGDRISIEDSENERVKTLLALEEKRDNIMWYIETMKNRLKAWADIN